MDLRYVVSGAIIISTSITFILYSITSNAELVLGPSLAILTLGIVVLTSGLSFREPLTEVLKLYANDLSRIISKVLEDSGLLGTHKLRVCLNELKVVLSSKIVKCSETSLGFGLAGDTPYLALPVDLSRLGITEVVGDDLREFLSEVISRRLKICRSVKVISSDDEYVIELNTVNETIYDLLKVPLNYLKVVVAVLTAKFLSREVELVDEELVGSNYVIKLKVI
ncbi:MAG: hypothetical protein QXH57_00340 [Sulfolobales archaeon]